MSNDPIDQEQGSRGVSSKGREIPYWLQNLKLPAPTKKYLTEQWLAGNFTVVDGPQDWGIITDIYDFLKFVVFKKRENNLYPQLSLAEIEQAQENASTDKSVLEQAIVNSPDGETVKFKGKTYTYDEAISYVGRLANIASDFGDAYNARKPKPTGEIANNTLMMQNTLQQDLQTAKRLAEEAWSTLTQELTVSPTTSKPFKQEYQAALKNLARAEDAAIKGGVKIPKTVVFTDTGMTRDVTAKAVTTAPATAQTAGDRIVPDRVDRTTATGGATISPRTADTAERAAQAATAKRLASDETLAVKNTTEVVKNGVTVVRTTYVDGSVTETAKVVSTGGGGGGGGPITVKTTPAQDARKAFVDAELVKRKLEDTPENRAALRKEYKPAIAAPSTDWEASFRATFPAKAWLLDQDRTKYPQLFALLQKAHDEKYYESTEGQARFAAELQGVDFYNELAASGKVKEIKKIVGDLGFDSTDFSKFVTDSINFGWTGETLKAETYKEVFRKNPDGTYANPTSVKRTTVGNDYLNVQLIAKNFFNSAPQSSVESVLTGGITTQDFQRQQREIAKKRYGHLADLIDQGVTLEDLAGNYKQTAAKLLEVDPNTIDMSQGDYEVALSFGDEGKKRAMTTGEWEKLLRTDARYGWEKTENAKTEARSLANNLAQAFGRII
jgi:hypothetical protein